MFHRVVSPDGTSPFGMGSFEITPQALEMAIRFFLGRGYRVISLDELCDSLTRGTDNGKFIVLTFDDGYKDVLTHAYPVLKRLDAPFTVNISVGFTERTTIKWDYLAEDVIFNNDNVVVDTNRGRVRLDCSTWDRKQASCGVLQDILYDMSDPASSERMRQFFSTYVSDVFGKTDELMLGWSQVEELAHDPLVTIGAHSVNHLVLSRLAASVAQDEILLSKRRLESRLGVEVSHFAYPYGRLHEAGEREYAAVKGCGFKSGATGMKGNIFPAQASKLQSLPRFCLGSNCTEPYLRTIANGTLPFLSNGFRQLPSSHGTQLYRDQG
jgi:peptidoglycan/xylan/chitin deacetylase (PgdA/CDA1 family)